ncbi:MAG: hypothetical protein Q4A15_10790 [Prevotellaceae bacterium]|nr:hypothetical protein [Prevotellaceae bacterium]
MVKKTITYTDYNGATRTEEFMFNLTKAEIMEMELSVTGGLTEMMKSVIASQDVPSLIKIFKDLILKSYGVKSPDGKRFIKSPELTEEFTQTEAYSQLFMELATNADEASKFVNGVVPEELRDAAAKAN